MENRFLVLCAVRLPTASASEQGADGDGDVTILMTDGTSARGWSSTDMTGRVEFFEMSDTPGGERVRYDNDRIARIVHDEGTVYERKNIIETVGGSKARPAWVRVGYKGNGIALYSTCTRNIEQMLGMQMTARQRHYYIALGQGPAVRAFTCYLTGSVIDAGTANRSLLNHLFGKRYPQYADLAKRIRAKEFDTRFSPIEVIGAWEEAYA
jgi:hypothetical protein